MARAGKSVKPLAYGLGAAALGLAAYVLWPFGAPEEAAPPATPEATETPEPPALAEGFYKVASAKTTLYADDNGKLDAILELDRGACVAVIEGSKGFETAKVRYEGFDAYIKKADISPAPDCEPNAAMPAATEQGQEKPQDQTSGYISTKPAILYAAPDGMKTVAQLPPKHCVIITNVRASEGWTRVQAYKGHDGTKVEGWGFDMFIDLSAPCKPAP